MPAASKLVPLLYLHRRVTQASYYARQSCSICAYPVVLIALRACLLMDSSSCMTIVPVMLSCVMALYASHSSGCSHASDFEMSTYFPWMPQYVLPVRLWQHTLCLLLQGEMINESGTMSGGGGKPRGGRMCLGTAAPKSLDTRAAAAELQAAEQELSVSTEVDI